MICQPFEDTIEAATSDGVAHAAAAVLKYHRQGFAISRQLSKSRITAQALQRADTLVGNDEREMAIQRLITDEPCLSRFGVLDNVAQQLA